MIIRPFTPADQQSTQQLILNGLKEYWGDLNPSFNRDLNQIADSYQDGYFLIAEQNGEIIGCGAFKPVGEGKVEIVRMSVHPKMRRLGVGRQLLDALLIEAKKRGYVSIILETTATWQGAIAFYQSYGFRPTHVLDGDQYFEYALS
ncbi:MAG: GNAT family N-acetyltransferase [Chloroflexota bacterium]